MTLMDNILRKVASSISMQRTSTGGAGGAGIRSPPPEMNTLEVIEMEQEKWKRKKRFKYADVPSKVDAYPPAFEPHRQYLRFGQWTARRNSLQRNNFDMLVAIRKTHFARGRVDSRWVTQPEPLRKYYSNRVAYQKRLQVENKAIYKLLVNTGPQLQPAESLRREWVRTRADIVARAQCKFVLFPPIPLEDIEDPGFVAPDGVKRPRAWFTLRIAGCAPIGELQVELFTDVCPQTCALFTELLAGHPSGYAYVGTHFFRKIPKLFWSGGDVAADNGFGCFKQSNRDIPIGAENFHFSHSMPGLLSMRVTCDDEVCGIFNITFKPMPQLDLKNVVFGRVLRPSNIFESIQIIGSPLSSHPPVELCASRLKLNKKWVHGTSNTRLKNNWRKR